MKTYTLNVVECEDSPGDMCIEFTEEFLQENGWRIDDVIKFVIEEDKTVKLINMTLEKRNESLHRSL